MNKATKILLLSAVIISASLAEAQTRPECTLLCPRTRPVCVGGHAQSYLSGLVNECTLRDEVHCLSAALAESSVRVQNLEKENAFLAREVSRLLKLLRIFKR